MVQTTEQQLTLEEFLKRPETKPESEYIDGTIIQKPMPQGKHSRIQGKLVNVINAIAETQRIALALPELRCTFGDQSRITSKILRCLDSGCQLGWLIDPEVRSLLVFPPQQQPQFFEEEDQLLPVPDFLRQLTLKLGDIFSWLKL